MSSSDCIEILKKHSVRPTPNRIIIIKALSEAGRPMSMTELEIKIPTIDKSNIFRTLSLFDEKHMVHRIDDGSEAVRFELCKSGHEDRDDDMHPHFYCEKCDKTFCIEDVPIPEVPVPENYEVHTVNFVMKGICPDCGRKS